MVNGSRGYSCLACGEVGANIFQKIKKCRMIHHCFSIDKKKPQLTLNKT